MKQLTDCMENSPAGWSMLTRSCRHYHLYGHRLLRLFHAVKANGNTITCLKIPAGELKRVFLRFKRAGEALVT